MVLFAVCVFLYIPMVNEVKDIPNAIHNEYIVTTGTAIGWNTTNDDTEHRGFTFLTDDGEEVDLSVLPCPKVYQGDRLEVMYLPNSGIGAIIQWLDDSD